MPQSNQNKVRKAVCSKLPRTRRRLTGPLICPFKAHRLVLRLTGLYCRECDWSPPVG